MWTQRTEWFIMLIPRRKILALAESIAIPPLDPFSQGQMRLDLRSL